MGKIIQFDNIIDQFNNLKNYGKNENILFSNKENNIVSFTKDSIQDKEFYCEDEFGNKLYRIDNPRNMTDINVIPNNVKTISSYWISTGEKIETIRTFVPTYNEPIYKVGLISDVHYNDTDNSDENPDTYNDDNSEYSEDLKNAMAFFEDNGVDFVSCSGDISTDSSDHLRNYRRCIDTYAPNVSVFTCSGNHDTKPKFKYRDLWLDIMAIDRNNEYEIVRFNDYEEYSKDLGDGNYDNYAKDEQGTSFYFKKYYSETEFDVYIYLNLEYGHNHRDNYWTHDPRILRQDELLVHTEVGQDDYHMYDPNTLRELERILDENYDHRCFIFTHIMFKNGAGTYHSTDLYNYYNDHRDVMRGDQGEFCEQLMNRYPKTYWFSGHSHYKWHWHLYDKTMNVKRMDSGAYTIHIPSLARPLNVSKWYNVALRDSEAGIMEVYKDYVIINGYVLKEENNYYINELKAELNNYPEENINNYVNASDITGDNNYFSVLNLNDNFIELNFYGQPTDIRLNLNGINSTNYKSYIPVFIFDFVEITNDYGEIITEAVKNEHKIGIRDNTTDTNEWDYYFESRNIYTMYEYGVLLKLSSLSSFVGQNIKVIFRARYGLLKTGYKNERYVLATYKLKRED